MNLPQLNVSKRPTKKRVGRGISAGGGKTAGRGTKGQNSRSGGQRNPGFEGGQNPLFQRIPKHRGFKSKRTPVVELKTSQLNALKAGPVTNETLVKERLVPANRSVKLLFDGPIAKAYKVHLQGASKAAQAAITKAGGSFAKTDLLLPKVAKAKSEKKPSA